MWASCQSSICIYYSLLTDIDLHDVVPSTSPTQNAFPCVFIQSCRYLYSLLSPAVNQHPQRSIRNIYTLGSILTNGWFLSFKSLPCIPMLKSVEGMILPVVSKFSGANLS